MRSFRDYLISAGYELDWLERPEGHSWGLWRATIDRMLEYFFPGSSTNIFAATTTSVDDFILYQNYPNPFNPATNIGFRISDFGFVELKVYDLAGREVATLVSENLPAGSYTYRWETRGLPSGVYFYCLKAGSFEKTRRMLLIR
jgi:enterochelin esterase family protein